MEKRDIRVRVAKLEDAGELLKIYAPYVENTAISFEYEPPSEEEFADRARRTLPKYPYLVAEAGGQLLGFAYAGPFHDRRAYDWAVETSIYVKQGLRRRGVGRALYEALENILREQNILNLNACVAYPEAEDPYLTKDSVAFHERLGFHLVGQFHDCGYKFGRWYHMVWLEKQIGPHLPNPPEVKPFAAVRGAIKEKYGIE